MRSRACVIILLFLFLLILGGCQNDTEHAISDNLIANESCLHPSPYNQEKKTREITWGGISIGESTKDQVIAKYGEPEGVISQIGNYVFHEICWMIYKDGFQFWLYEGRVIAINQSNYGFRSIVEIDMPKKLEDLTSLYGKPDIVGWHAPYSHPGMRLVVWPEEGILANVNIESKTVANVMFFYPIAEKDFLNSSLSQFISFTRTPSDDVVELMPRDPFHWEDN